MPVTELSTSRLLEELQTARQRSDQLFSILKRESLYDRPIAERHRVIFYIGHLDGFDSIEICREGLGLKSPDQQFDKLFQAGIDPDSDHLPSDKPEDWPSLEQVEGYLRRCRDHVDAALDRAPEELVNTALEHRLMHLETLAYMFHNFNYSTKICSMAEPLRADSLGHAENGWISIPEGIATVGKANDGSFGWDNEYEETVDLIPSFEIQRYSITNGAYLRFVNEGARAPHFWVRRDGTFMYRGMFEEIPLPLDWPVYVTHDEAAAYAKWIGKSLPSEEQFHRAAFGSPSGGERRYPWGVAAPSATVGNFDFRQWDPEPVTATPEGKSAFGVEQLVGNGWEWTNTVFAPLPGFQSRSYYPGYSANFFDGEHFVLKGGSARTAARLLRRSFRNWFRHDYPYTYATFRCVGN